MNYTSEDKICTHCGGNISDHLKDVFIRWCDNCGSNDKDSPPNVEITFHEIKREDEKKSTQNDPTH